MGCVHRSILPENLHFDKDLNLKLAHFALAVDLDQAAVPCASASVVDYLAPEVMRHCFIHFA
jgi:serine/threonine protein kinase